MAAVKRAHQLTAGEPRGPADDAGRLDVANRLEKIFAELAEVRSLMNYLDGAEPALNGRESSRDTLWSGIEAIQQAINKTRLEIGALHANGLRDRQINRASDELDTVVSDTEQATQSILSSAEAIDRASGLLMSRLDGADRERAAEVRDHVIHIFEACNFQDIAGQRLSKVVSLLHFIESSVANMADIWVDSSRPEGGEAEAGEHEGLLNGPALAGDQGVVSQDDIDSLFN
jgi:chemotaxis protein CheZ